MPGIHRRSIRVRCSRLMLVAVLTLSAARGAAQNSPLMRQYADGTDDVRRLRFDGGDAPPVGTSGLIDLIGYRIGGWTPDDAPGTLFRGVWSSPADFFRLDLVFDGLVNPPGLGFPSNIFFFGDNPLLGFVEFDVDANPASGGELAGAQFRYQGAAGRYGGVPQPARYDERMALNTCPGTFDADVSTGPYFPERSGEEFHLAFLWGAVTAVDVGSNGDLTFEAGEAWVVRGKFLNRAFGFNDFVLVCCSNGLPTYSPEVDLLFSHSPDTDRTTVSLVYPLTQTGAAAITGGPAEPADCCAANQNSVEEALAHVVFSAQLASSADRNDVNFPLIAPWEFQQEAVYLEPVSWVLNAVFAAVFTDPDTLGPTLAWSDVAPNVHRGDFNADGVVNTADVVLFGAFLADADGGACDADGSADGAFTVIDFGNGFDVHDLNYDGVVDSNDQPTPQGDGVLFDFDGDGDVDLFDYAAMQRCATMAAGGFVPAECEPLDVDQSGQVDVADLSEFTNAIQGPQTPMMPLLGGAPP